MRDGQDNAETKRFIDEPYHPSGSTSPLWYHGNHDGIFSLYLLFTTIAIILPWIFFWILQVKGGIPIHNSVLERIPKDTAYAATVLSTIIASIMIHLFSTAVALLARKRVLYTGDAISHISFFTAFSNRAPSLSLFHQGRRGFFLVFFYWVIFLTIVPGIANLLTPISYIHTVPLHGKELDFASNDTDCIDWFRNHTTSNSCNWEVYNGLNYTDCVIGNQLTDILQSGISNMQYLIPNNDVVTAYAQLGLRLEGTVKGLLPISPNGMPAFNTFDERSDTSLPDVAAGLHSTYNYTLGLQGVSSKVECTYDPESPITYTALGNFSYQYNASCFPGTEFSMPAVYYVPHSNNTLASWVCRTAAESYTLYLQGTNYYESSIGNMTCNISSIHPTVFPVSYTGQSGIFTTTQPAISTSPGSNSELASSMVASVETVIWQAQTVVTNLVAESITTFIVKTFGQQPNVRDGTRLRLYEAMIQGILEYTATYVRFLYATQVNDLTPESCMRTIDGSLELEVFGWNSTRQTSVYLFPITLINLTTLVILVFAMRIGDDGAKLLPRFDPTDSQSLILSYDPTGINLLTATAHPTDPAPWRAWVALGRNKDGIYRLWPKDEVVSK